MTEDKEFIEISKDVYDFIQTYSHHFDCTVESIPKENGFRYIKMKFKYHSLLFKVKL